MIKSLAVLLTLIPLFCLDALSYHVVFQGPISKEIKEVLSTNSNLKLLEGEPPTNLIALKRRAEADVPNLVYALHSLGYYNARVDFDINESGDLAIVSVTIEPGPVYPILGYRLQSSNRMDQKILSAIHLNDIGIQIGSPAFTKTILEGEDKLLELLAQRGYPLATIEKRKVVADQKEKGIYVTLIVNQGLQVVFGPTSVHGLETVNPSVVHRRIAWCEGDPYDPACIGKTEFELESLGLFSSITIIENEEKLDDNLLPIEIYLKEACHRTIGFGVSYNTQLGLGGTFNWEHRNMRGEGERFKIKSDIWQRKQTGILEYIVPDFLTRYQELKFFLEADKEQTEGYDEFFYSGTALVDRIIDCNLRFSYGLGYKQLFSSKSDNNRPSHLLKTPLFLRYSSVDQTLCPTNGYTFAMRFIPTFNLYPQFAYFINLGTVTGYYPLIGDEFLVLAGKAHVGSIYGSRRHTIPPPERFYAGSECVLRGYKYMTVSPLDKENKPIGGRSIMVYSLETRFRMNSFGWAFFYEVGNVYGQIIPQFFHKQLQSLGLGFRYFTQMGPLRFDLAFPLNPRKGIDKPFQLYISIGQAF